MDRVGLVRKLSNLTPADLAKLIASLPGSAKQVGRHGTVGEQVGQLIEWAESTTGRGLGLEGVEIAYEALFGAEPSSRVSRPRNLPFSTIGSLFKGRDHFLAEIRTILTGNDGRAVAVHGLGGVGKTRVALEYAWKHESEYTGLLFVSASSAAELRANLANLVSVLTIAPAETAVDEQVSEVLRWLEAHPGWLLLIDSVGSEEAARDVRNLLVGLRTGHVLITARISNWPASVVPRELSVLTEADAVSFLLQRTGQRRRLVDDTFRCAEIASELGYLALALEQAGAYINKLRFTFGEYLDRWRQKRLEVLGWYDARLMEYPASVAVTWETTFAQLSEPEQRLLQVLAWLAPEPIPLFFFAAAPLIAAFPEPREALAGLAAFSLARFETEADAVVIHRLVQEVARGRADETAKARSLQTALAAIDASDIGEPRDVRSWTVWTPLAPHVASVVAHADPANVSELTSRVMIRLGEYCLTRGQFREAEPVMRRALAVAEQCYGTDHARVNVALGNLAHLLWATGRLAEAEPLMCRVLATYEQSYGKDHRDVAAALNNLALLLRDTNRLGEAEPLLRLALVIAERSSGRDHPNVAAALHNLASLLFSTDKPAEAEPLMRRALAVNELCYGQDHPDVAICVNDLAQLLKATDRLAEAEPLMRRALAIDEQSYGLDHPSVARDLNNLALLLLDTNRLAEAEPLMRRALAIDVQSHGEDQPEVAMHLNSLAMLLKRTNRLAEAEPLMRRVLAIFRRFRDTTGYEHPHQRTSIGNYRSLLAAMSLTRDQIEAKVREVVCSNAPLLRIYRGEDPPLD
jgi:tetratricopeptide (TPR) repeat protein